MKKVFYFLVGLNLNFFLFFNSNVKAQNIILTTQAQVDAFNQTSTPGNLFLQGGNITNLAGLSELTTIGGNLFINGTGLTDLSGLSNLTAIGDRNLSILNNNLLTSLAGLSGLTSLSALSIRNNSNLLNIDGLSNLVTVSSFIEISGNDNLLNIDGLSGITGTNEIEIADNDALTSIGGLSTFVNIALSLSIDGNDALTNIDGLSGLVSPLANISIGSNEALANVNGLSNLKTAKGNLIIQFNPALASMGLTSLEKVEGGFVILGNKSLTSIAGLSKLAEVVGNLQINVNSLLLGPVSGLPNLNGLESLLSVGGNLEVIANKDLVNFCGLYNLFHSGTIGGTVEIVRNGANTVGISVQQPEIVVYADQGACSATLWESFIPTPTISGCLEPFEITHSDFPAGFVFPVGETTITWKVTDGAGNSAVTTQALIVVDTQDPVITCPQNLTVKCASDVPAVNVNAVTATDNCSAIVTHVSDVVSDSTCINRFKITRTYKATDPRGNSATCSQVITVYDDVAPQINGLTVSQTAIWPPNHKMKDITLTYTVTDNCTNTPTTIVTVTSNEDVNGTGDGDTDPDWEIVDDRHIKLRAERAANGNGRIYTITVTVNDGCNPAVVQTKNVYVAHNITAPQSGNSLKVGSTVSFAGVFQDKAGNTHTAKWLLDGTAVANGVVTEPSGNQNGKVTGSYKFNTPGVYKLQMNVIDQAGNISYANTNDDVDAIVVIYDPNGGYAYGGGWFPSAAGALASDPAATGKASYGFAVNYRNAAKPKGETQFEFKVGTFEFNALNFEYLSVAGAKAQFRGTGKIIGGQSGVNFIMTVTDGALDGTGVDRIRLKLFKNGQVYYDNQAGASDADNPSTAVGSNSIIYIQGTPVNSLITSAAQKEIPEEIMTIKNLEALANPNPSNSYFSVQVNSNNTKEKIILRVYDVNGKILDVRTSIIPGSFVRFGDLYRSGTYFVRVIQGREHKELKLIKVVE